MDPSAIAAGKVALFLDFDGTLVEIAPTPDSVVVPPDLPPLLGRLSARLDGALAVVSGRPLAEIETLLPVPLAIAGDHGGTRRPAPGAAVEVSPLPLPPPVWMERTVTLASAYPGTLVEPKAHGFVLHYRLAPEAADPGGVLLRSLVATREDFVLMPAHMAWEVKPRAVSKATAVEFFMARAPFAGRQPVFVGDDVTDEAGMEAARAAGGLGYRLQDTFGTPAAFRAWLARLEAAGTA